MNFKISVIALFCTLASTPVLSAVNDESNIFRDMVLEDSILTIPGDTGRAINTTVNQGGRLWLTGTGNSAVPTKFAENTVVNNGGFMFLITRTVGASGIIINEGGRLYAAATSELSDIVMNGGTAEFFSPDSIRNLTIGDGASATFGWDNITAIRKISGLKILKGGFFGLTGYNVNGKDSNFEDASVGGVMDITYAGYVNFKSLHMDDGEIIINHSPPYHTVVNIGDLSGTGSFAMNTSLADRTADFIHIQHGTGRFGLIVNDSGRDITDHEDLTLNLVNEVSGDASFELVGSSGKRSPAVDGGTYMYTLHRGKDKDGLSGTVWYLGVMTDEPDNGGGDGG
ncbi:pertactin-like passenger domain-containing protein, partial [Enterobacter hormaechei]|uniref:pertactin-like passenger domain-containing protein n=1 Tax=Enterobacter hormaechei TaxID=158836 RepID=UPI0034CF7407